MLRGVQVVVTGMALAGFVLAGPLVARAQEPAAAPQEPAKPVLPLEGEAVQITMLIKPDKTADFETVLAKYKESLAKSENPQRKQQLEGIKIYKGSQPVQGNAVYFMMVDPVIKDQEYDISRIIAEVFPVEVQQIFELYKGSFAGRGITSLTKVQ
ncbi:MAG: hypothetical protein IT178_03670 [Acidobacteria bacterium]|nr:hypothetical protein [Acidobacteriota bacterium]